MTLFDASRDRLLRRFFITLAILLLATPMLAVASWQCVGAMFSTPHLWIPESNPQRAEFDWFTRSFESQALVVVSWPGCNLSDPRLIAFEDAIRDAESPHHPDDADLLFDRVVSGPSAFQQLTNAPLRLSESAAIARLRGVLVGPDDHSTCAIVMFTEKGGYERKRALDTIRRTVRQAAGISPADLKLAGPAVNGVAIDRAGIATLARSAIPSALAAWLVCAVCLRNWKLTIPILLAAVIGEGISLALVQRSGTTMNAILILMPALVFVVTMASGVHFANYFREEVGVAPLQNAVQRAMNHGMWPSILATTTTCIGLTSLLLSSVEPVRSFGGFSTLTILSTLILLLLMIPGAMTWSLPNPATHRPHPQSPTQSDEQSKNSIWITISRWVVLNPNALLIGSIGILMLAGSGLTSLRASVKLRELFSEKERIVADYEWLEKNIGPMAPIEVVLRFNTSHESSFEQRLHVVESVARQLELHDAIDGVLSAATFRLANTGGRGLGSLVRKRIQRKVLEDAARNARLMHSDQQYQSWRLSMRAPALGQIEYDQVLSEIELQANQVVSKLTQSDKSQVETIITGAIPLIDQTQRILLRDLATSFLSAFAVVSLVLMFVLRSVPAGLLAMLPNLLPSVVVFGTLGWLKIPLDIATIMTASIALGIGVVDTLHFVIWFRRDVADGFSSEAAVHRAYRHCAPAMLHTSVICAFGMLPFAMSSFVPATKFAILVIALLALALLSDLLVLPALLTGPFRRFFRLQATAPEAQ